MSDTERVNAIASPEDLALAREVTAAQKRLDPLIAEAGQKLDKLAVLAKVDEAFDLILWTVRAAEIHESAVRALEQMKKRARSLIERFVMEG